MRVLFRRRQKLGDVYTSGKVPNSRKDFLWLVEGFGVWNLSST